MKATQITHRPTFPLLKQTDLQAFYHLQMPRWLFSDSRYRTLPLEAKVAYSFLLNRFQLSKLNGWINDDGEVFIIYTRESLAEEIQLSYRKIIDCMKALNAAQLIYERRCGRGDANQIYLAKVEDLEQYDINIESAPFVSRSAESAGLDFDNNAVIANDSEDIRPANIAHQEVQEIPIPHIKTCENGSSASAETAHQDMHKPHTSNTYKSYTKKNYYIRQSVASPPRNYDTTDMTELEEILEACDLWTFPEATAKVFESAIERLFYTERYRIGDAILPQKRVRAHLHWLDGIKLREAADKLAANTKQHIRNTTAYTMAVIFNAIWESESDVMCDPYLNELRAPESKGGG